MDLVNTSASELLSRMTQGRLTAEVLMAASLDQIASRNGALNAIVALRDRDQLMAEARAADQVPVTDRGALHGLPFAIKDLANARGIATSQGSPVFAGHVAQADDIFVARIRAAGAIIIGKTNTPEFGLGSHTFNPVYGATGNVTDPQRSAGGSSGGAAVALAAGMVPLADGSDMMGSLRNPAGWNGVYGFRPTWGTVPSQPKGDLFLHTLSTNGPMARTPQDLALLLEVMSATDPLLPLSKPQTPLRPLSEPQPLRLGWLGDWGGAYPMEDGVLETCEAGLAQLEAMGHQVVRLEAPFAAQKLWQSWTTLRSYAVASGLRALSHRRADLKEAAVWELDRGLRFSGAEIQAASDIRSDWLRAVTRLFGDYDMLMLPTAQCWPFAIQQEYPTEIAGVAMDSYHRWMEVVVPVSLIGLPCLAMPVGVGAQGLPMGLQIFGAHGADREILSLGQSYHNARTD